MQEKDDHGHWIFYQTVRRWKLQAQLYVWCVMKRLSMGTMVKTISKSVNLLQIYIKGGAFCALISVRNGLESISEHLDPYSFRGPGRPDPRPLRASPSFQVFFLLATSISDV